MTEPTPTTGNGTTPTTTAKQESNQSSNMDGMILRIRNSIERDGNFGEPLNDMAEGYSAGKGCSFFEAKNAIKDRFYNQMGMSPKEYLDQSFSQKPNYAQNGNRNGYGSNGHSNNQTNTHTKSRGR